MCKERPILFNADMVRAILDGRKTQTRRMVKLPRARDAFTLVDRGHGWWPYQSDDGESALCSDGNEHPYSSPYGQPGDRLWVRETWLQKGRYVMPSWPDADPEEATWMGSKEISYAADDLQKTNSGVFGEENWRKRPSIHMPRWASRITLEIVSVRVERLQDISEADAHAEGFKCVSKDGELFKWGLPDEDGLPGTDDFGWPWVDWKHNPCNAFAQLWDQINGELAWNANPWVWVVEFKRVEASQ